ncbi:UNVERIFIED_CONTAM: hypothetical protein PYX00_011313 [Menopon gallinae]|uniref:DNA-directed RNA polymerase RBP11-like dimerisation domain-containing protein n=1 Tax=Menopon gallinae TaxID=328185 RepID=A0AAW2H7B1_9NEOP
MEDTNESLEQTKRLETKSAYQISIGGEDHTLLNVLRYAVNKKCSDVELCGYTIPHPSESTAIFRVQFKSQHQQTADNVYKTLADALEYVDAIGERLMSEVST